MIMCKEGKSEFAFEFLFREIVKTMKLKDWRVDPYRERKNERLRVSQKDFL